MMVVERPVVFCCAGKVLLGVLHEPSELVSDVGVVVVVGGPQYRVGSHRQFVTMARKLAAHGWVVFRFDYRGMGDSDGIHPGFEHVGEDIRTAIEAVCSANLAVRRIVLLGLCDAASAALMYGRSDQRVAGMILLNPWVRTPEGQAKVLLSRYYRDRVLSRGFWAELLTGRVRVSRALADAVDTMRRLWPGRPDPDTARSNPTTYLDRMRAGANEFAGAMLFILSEHDLTAEEFRHLVRATPEWKVIMDRENVQVHTAVGADHTLSVRTCLDEVCRVCAGWLSKLNRPSGATQVGRRRSCP